MTVEASPVWRDPQGFEFRRRARFGRFVLDSTFEREWQRPVPDVIAAHAPGLIVVTTEDDRERIARAVPEYSLRGAATCFPDVFVDGVRSATRI